jgi:hypothetical protein
VQTARQIGFREGDATAVKKRRMNGVVASLLRCGAGTSQFLSKVDR